MVDKVKDKILHYRVDADTEQTINDIYGMLKADPRKYGYRFPKDINKGVTLRFMAITTISAMDEDVDIKKIIEPEVISPEDKKKREEYERNKDYLESNCNRGLLKLIDGIPTCGQKITGRGISSQEPFVYADDLPRSGELMDISDIITTCEQCKQKFSEEKRLQRLMRTVEIASGEREVDRYRCEHPNLYGKILLTLFVDAKFLCPDDGRNVRIDRTCIKRHCKWLIKDKMIVPPVESEEHDLEE